MSKAQRFIDSLRANEHVISSLYEVVTATTDREVECYHAQIASLEAENAALRVENAKLAILSEAHCSEFCVCKSGELKKENHEHSNGS